jgi:hypothetical protein
MDWGPAVKHEAPRTYSTIERHHDVARVEAFSDAVFAFAATLPALGIRIRRPESDLPRVEESARLGKAYDDAQTPSR